MELNNELNVKLENVFNTYSIETNIDTSRSFFRNLYYLFKTNLFVIRQEWVWYLLMVCITPLSLLIFLGFYLKGQSQEVLLFIITGNMVMSLVTSSMLTLGQTIGLLKHYKAFDYYATLPISKVSLIISLVTRATLLSIPSMFVIFLIGSIYLHIPMEIHPIIILVILLGGYSLAGIGAVIGIYSRNVQTASLITQIVQPIVVFLAPVLIPETSLPTLVKYSSFIMPTRYVAKAFRSAAMGQIAYLDIFIIFVISVVTVYLVGIKLDWRVED